MRDELEPVAGNWYRHIDKGQMFRVVDVDQEHDVIEIQYFDGDLEEIDADAWADMDLDLAEPPEDASGPLDEAATEDASISETAMSASDWRKPLAGNKSETEEWEDETDEDERDEWDEGVSGEELSDSE